MWYLRVYLQRNVFLYAKLQQAPFKNGVLKSKTCVKEFNSKTHTKQNINFD